MAVLAGLASPAVSSAQPYDLLLKGGRLLDAKNQIDAERDVAIKGGRIAAVAATIASDQAKKVVDARGLYVAPGFVDLHTHVFTGQTPRPLIGGGSKGVWADGFTLRSGGTTAVDAGSSGWRGVGGAWVGVMCPQRVWFRDGATRWSLLLLRASTFAVGAIPLRNR